jgi:hypothetical protein
MLAWSTSYPSRAARRLRAFDGEQRRISIAATAALPALHLIAQFGGLRAIRRVLRVGSPSSTRVDGIAAGKHLANPVATVASALRLDRRGCVARATFLWWLLRRRGIAAEVVIGSRMIDGRLEAHAWVEVDGSVIDDAPDVRERYPAFEGAGSVMGRA